MKKKSLFVVALSAIVLLMASCGDSATSVNQIIVGKMDKAVDMMNEVADFVDADEYDQALTKLGEITTYVAESKEAISKLDNASAKDFIQGAVEYLDVVNEGIASYKQAIELYQIGESNAEMRQANDLINDFIEKAGDKYEEVSKVQTAFANANGITLR